MVSIHVLSIKILSTSPCLEIFIVKNFFKTKKKMGKFHTKKECDSLSLKEVIQKERK